MTPKPDAQMPFDPQTHKFGMAYRNGSYLYIPLVFEGNEDEGTIKALADIGHGWFDCICYYEALIRAPEQDLVPVADLVKAPLPEERQQALESDSIYQSVHDLVHATPSGRFDRTTPASVWGEYMYPHRETLRQALTSDTMAERLAGALRRSNQAIQINAGRTNASRKERAKDVWELSYQHDENAKLLAEYEALNEKEPS